MALAQQLELPVQPVEKPILCSPYVEPQDHWLYDRHTGTPRRAGFRRPAGYWYKTERTGSTQISLFAEEERDDLPLVNKLRDEVRRWRESQYRGASHVTKALLQHWTREDHARRLFFCQREAVETLIYLAELRLPGRSSRTGFRHFEVSDDDLRRLLQGVRPTFAAPQTDYFPTLVDTPADASLLPLRRLGCKMATGAGKTVLMAMLIAWAFCNRGANPHSQEFPHAVLVLNDEGHHYWRPAPDPALNGIPFSVIPFKGRPGAKAEPDDKPKHHVRALPERSALAIRFPVVEGYAFALRKNAIRCDMDDMEPLILEPTREPTATFVAPTVGYQEGTPSQAGGLFPFIEQSRGDYYAQTHLQTIMFQVTRLIVDDLTTYQPDGSEKRRRVLRLQSRHQLFPQVYRYVEAYVQRKVRFEGCHPCELGLQKYVERLVERFREAIVPDDSQGELPLLPLLNRYKPIGTTAEVDFKTTRPCFALHHSHLNQVVADTRTWESSAAFKLEQLVQRQVVRCYARNDHLGCVIPYEYMHVEHSYEPDFLVRLAVPGQDVTVVLEIKGYEGDQTLQKHQAAQRWVQAVNTWGKLGQWTFHVCRNPQTLDTELTYVQQQWLQRVRVS